MKAPGALLSLFAPRTPTFPISAPLTRTRHNMYVDVGLYTHRGLPVAAVTASNSSIISSSNVTTNVVTRHRCHIVTAQQFVSFLCFSAYIYLPNDHMNKCRPVAGRIRRQTGRPAVRCRRAIRDTDTIGTPTR